MLQTDPCEFLIFGGEHEYTEDSDQVLLFKTNFGDFSKSEILETGKLKALDSFEDNHSVIVGNKIYTVGWLGAHVYDMGVKGFVDFESELG